DRAELARQLRSRGRDRDAGIVDIGALIAADSALVGPVLDAVRGGADAIVAVQEAAEAQAALLAALPDPDLAQRAGDVRQIAAARARSVAAVNPAHSAAPAGPVRTADGEQVTLLCNVASAAETRLGLSGGAAGVGLLRTEIPFIGATGWPAEADHLAQLTPVL